MWPVGPCDRVSLEDHSSAFGSALVGHPSGHSRWDFDACSVSSIIMEGKLYLVFECMIVNFISCF